MELEEAVKRCSSESGNGCYGFDGVCSLSSSLREVPCKYLNKKNKKPVSFRPASGGDTVEICFGCDYAPNVKLEYQNK